MRVAIADNEVEVLVFLQSVIEELGHQPTSFSDGHIVMDALAKENFDLLILDWNLPGQDGRAILQARQQALPKFPPVIVMSNRAAKRDISDALHAGADDYIAKPESRSVVAARISAQLDRNSRSVAFETQRTFGNYHFDRLKQSVTNNGRTVVLTAKEFELADMFFRNADRTLSRRYIMEAIWRTTATLATRTLDMHISRIRSKLDLRAENGFSMFTVFGYGYRLETTAAVEAQS